MTHDLHKGYLQIFPDSLQTAPTPAVGEAAEGEATEGEATEGEAGEPTAPVTETVAALLQEFATMRLKLVPKKGLNP